MSSPAATQILTFENFGALEGHLRTLKNKYSDMIKSYEEALGYILRDTRPNTTKNQQMQQKWAQDMQEALLGSDPRNKIVAARREDGGKKLFGNKDKHEGPTAEWVPLDPMSVFVGPKNKGLAEIYFETINLLKDNINKITSALSICSAVKAKAAMSGNTAVVVCFVNDIPTKVLLKPVDESASKKYTMSFSFAVPGMPAPARSLR